MRNVSRIAVLSLTLSALLATGIGAGENDAMMKSDRPVESQLELLKEQSDKQTPPAVLEAGRLGTEQLIREKFVDGALKRGDTMPAFTLKDAHGKTRPSANLIADGPIVLVFYRGAWCPFCNLYLRSIQEYLPQIEAAGATLVAVSGENPDRSLAVEERNELTFTVLSDPGFDVARKFGIVYEMPKVTNDAILELGFDLTKYYGTEHAELPLSATYVIDADGTIAYAFLDADYKRRAEPADLLMVLEKLK